jgi:hypothetical protein
LENLSFSKQQNSVNMGAIEAALEGLVPLKEGISLNYTFFGKKAWCESANRLEAPQGHPGLQEQAVRSTAITQQPPREGACTGDQSVSQTWAIHIS